MNVYKCSRYNASNVILQTYSECFSDDSDFRKRKKIKVPEKKIVSFNRKKK